MLDAMLIWKCLILFIFIMTFFWIIFFTFQPDFLNSNDKAKNGNRGHCSGDDCYLSGKGRTKVFLFSLIPAGVVTIVYIFYCYYFMRSVLIKCDSGAKKVGDCKIIEK